MNLCVFFFFFQAEDGIRDLVRSRGLGDVYKRQVNNVNEKMKQARILFDLPAASFENSKNIVRKIP